VQQLGSQGIEVREGGVLLVQSTALHVCSTALHPNISVQGALMNMLSYNGPAVCHIQYVQCP
jgi:hypothetical protein